MAHITAEQALERFEGSIKKLVKNSAGRPAALVDIERLRKYVVKQYRSASNAEAKRFIMAVIVLQEWTDIMKEEPHWQTAVRLFQRLVKKARTTTSERTLMRTPQWRAVDATLKSRLDFDYISSCKCKRCGTRYNAFIDYEGFIDDYAAYICVDCGTVMCKSAYEEKRLSTCLCGGRFTRFCPQCGSRKYTVTSRHSAAAYLKTHRYYWA